MSKYTTEVRFICEQKAGYDESKGFNSVDEILNESWNKIFTTNATFYDPAYKPIICKKILKHYYTREIAAETVGLWLLWMNTKLEEILPYYNKLWSSALLEFDPFKDVDYTKTGARKGTKTEEQSGQFNTSGNASNTRTDNLTQTNEVSAWDASTFQNRDKTTNSGTQRNAGTKTNSGTVRDAGSLANTGTVRNAGTVSDNGNSFVTETFHVEGDSAITDAQDVARKEIELRQKYDLYQFIINDFKNRYCLLVY